MSWTSKVLPACFWIQKLIIFEYNIVQLKHNLLNSWDDPRQCQLFYSSAKIIACLHLCYAFHCNIFVQYINTQYFPI